MTIPESTLEPVRDALRGQRAGVAFGALVLELAAMGCVLPASPAFCRAINMEYSQTGAWVFGIFGAVMAITSAFVLRRFFALIDIEREPILWKLVHDPEDVVWVYGDMLTEHRVNGVMVNQSMKVFVRTESGLDYQIDIRADAAPKILSRLALGLPHATVGAFSNEDLARYRSDPKSLRLMPDVAKEAATYRDAPTRKPLPMPKPPRGSLMLALVICFAVLAMTPTLAGIIWAATP